jgi:uncharacterized membrane protein YjjP (DUF1212 family)
MTREPRKFPTGVWVFLFAALAGCIFGILYGVFNALVIAKSGIVIGEVARYTVGFGIAGVITGLVSGLIVTIVKKAKASR